jgi:hypothetical protein
MPARVRQDEWKEVRRLHPEPAKEHTRRPATDVEVVDTVAPGKAEKGHRAKE